MSGKKTGSAPESRNKTVELLRASGSHKEMGRAQGAACREAIRGARKMMADSEELKLLKPPLFPTAPFLLLGEAVSWLKYAPAIRARLPRQFSRIKGIARGAGVSPSFALFLQSFEPEMNRVNFHIGGCSALGVAGSRSAAGEPMIAKNFDYPEKFKPLHLTRLDAPKGRFRSLNVSAAPLAGNHDGVNEKGLAISYNYGYGQDRPGANVPITLLVQEALETCAMTEEAVRFIQSSRWIGGALLTVCDADGDLRALEMSNARAADRRATGGLVINTNHYHSEEMKPLDIPEDAVYGERSARPLRGLCCRASTEARYARLYKLAAKKEKLSEKDLIGIFSDHGPEGEPSDNTICRHDSYMPTTCSILLFPKRREMKVAYANPCEADYRTFRLTD